MVQMPLVFTYFVHWVALNANCEKHVRLTDRIGQIWKMVFVAYRPQTLVSMDTTPQEYDNLVPSN